MVGKQERRYQRMITVVLALISLIMVIPLVLLVVASFTSNNEIVLHGYSFFPKELSLEAYRYIWNERAQVFHAYGITILVTAIGTTIGVMMTLLYAYVLAHEKFPGKTFLAFYLFFTMLFNGGLVPTYIMYTRYLHMKNTIPALIIPGLLMSAFNVILTRTYIQSNVPAALSEAAKIDGCGILGTLFRILVPVVKPALVTASIFAFYWIWQDFFQPLIFMSTTKKFTISLALNMYLDPNSYNNYGGLFAMSVISLLPVLVFFIIFQKYLVDGIAMDGIKG